MSKLWIALFSCVYLATALHVKAQPTTGQWYEIESKLNKLHLDVQGGSKNAKTTIWMFTPNTTAAQHWMLESADGGYYYIKSKVSGLYLDVKGGNKAAKTPIWQYPLNRTDAQKWKPIPAGGGYYYLQSKLSKLYLDVQGGRKTARTPVWQYPLNRTDAQKWKFKRLGPTIDGTTLRIENGKFVLPEHLQPAFEDVAVWQISIKVRTNDSKNAGSDSEVYVQLRNGADSKFYLDRGGDDRERGKTNVYRVIDPGIRTISDIKFLRLGIEDTDGWQLNLVELYINGNRLPVFYKNFWGGRWLDKNSDHPSQLMVSSRVLRAHKHWRHSLTTKGIWWPPAEITQSMLESMIESYIGHQMNADPRLSRLEYGKRKGRSHVELKYDTPERFHVDLDLKAKINNSPDIPVDVDFKLYADCSGGRVSFSIRNAKAEADVPGLTSLLNLLNLDFHKRKLDDINIVAPVPICPSMQLTRSGNILFSL